MLKVPYGISDYKELKSEGYYYVDKTMYLQKLEDVGKKLVYLRPGRFGKSLFTPLIPSDTICMLIIFLDERKQNE